MIITFEINGTQYQADLSRPVDISIPLQPGTENPNCYWADPPEFQTIVSGDFVGSVAKGGSVNYQKIIITPHGNGTHTECFGHISPRCESINQSLQTFHFIAQLITVETKVQNGDLVIIKEEIESRFERGKVEGLIFRTTPNGNDKLTKKYSGTNPPYFTREAMEFIRAAGIMHLLTDLPSVDKEVDEGRLLAHRAFWDFPDHPRKNATITELIYVPDFIEDGIYLVNLQIISLETDACPSKPLLYPIATAEF